MIELLNKYISYDSCRFNDHTMHHWIFKDPEGILTQQWKLFMWLVFYPFYVILWQHIIFKYSDLWKIRIKFSNTRGHERIKLKTTKVLISKTCLVMRHWMWQNKFLGDNSLSNINHDMDADILAISGSLYFTFKLPPFISLSLYFPAPVSP